jgi:hypothetical protein
MSLLDLLKRIEFRGDGFECPECSRLGMHLDAGVHASGCELKAAIDEMERDERSKELRKTIVDLGGDR